MIAFPGRGLLRELAEQRAADRVDPRAAAPAHWARPPELELFGFRVAAVVPEPGTGSLFALGLLALALSARRRFLR